MCQTLISQQGRYINNTKTNLIIRLHAMAVGVRTYNSRMLQEAETIDDARVRAVITKTCLYNFDPLKPHFYTVKLGHVYTLFFLFLLKNIDCRYSLEPPLPTIYVFEQKYEKYQSFFICKFSVFRREIFYIFK